MSKADTRTQLRFHNLADVDAGPPTRYTPGPWFYEQDRGASFTSIGEPIAVVGGEPLDEPVAFTVGRRCDFGPHGAARTRANARLMASAPDLLQACKAALDHCPEAVQEQLRRAICRAEEDNPGEALQCEL